MGSAMGSPSPFPLPPPLPTVQTPGWSGSRFVKKTWSMKNTENVASAYNELLRRRKRQKVTPMCLRGGGGLRISFDVSICFMFSISVSSWDLDNI